MRPAASRPFLLDSALPLPKATGPSCGHWLAIQANRIILKQDRGRVYGLSNIVVQEKYELKPAFQDTVPPTSSGTHQDSLQ